MINITFGLISRGQWFSLLISFGLPDVDTRLSIHFAEPRVHDLVLNILLNGPSNIQSRRPLSLTITLTPAISFNCFSVITGLHNRVVAWPGVFKVYCIAISRLSSTAIGKAGQSSSRRTGGMFNYPRHRLRHSRPVLCFVLAGIVVVIWVIMIVGPIVLAHFKVRALLFGVPCRQKIDEIRKDIASKDQSYDPLEDRRNILMFGESRNRENYCQGDLDGGVLMSAKASLGSNEACGQRCEPSTRIKANFIQKEARRTRCCLK